MSEIEVDCTGDSINGGKPHEEDDQQKVEILLKTIGPLRPRRVKVPPCLKVHDLRKLLAENECLPINSLSLILRGTVLNDRKNGEDVHVKLKNGDSLIITVKRKGPPKRIGSDDDDDDEDDLKFQLPESTSQWKWRLFCLLRDKLKLPDLVLMAIFSLSLKAWALILLWFVLAPVAQRWDIGPLYILGTGFAIIFFNLGKRQEGDLSAYSIFNEEFRELPGTLNADRLDRDIRAEGKELTVKMDRAPPQIQLHYSARGAPHDLPQPHPPVPDPSSHRAT